MEVKITTKMLADRMLATYKEDYNFLNSYTERDLRELLGDEFVNEAYTEFKNTVVLDSKNALCKGCFHCHRVKDICSSVLFFGNIIGGYSLSQGYCDLLRARVRLNGCCGNTKREGGME